MIRRSFIQVSTAWYAATALSGESKERFDIVVEGDDWEGSFIVNWPENLAVDSAQLMVLDDAWKALAHCHDVISRIGDSQAKLSPESLRKHLLQCGFIDGTEREQPSKEMAE